MPAYDYSCRKCGKVEEHYRAMDQRDNAPIHCGKGMAREIAAARVMPDIQPYKAVAADKESGKQPYITSRKQHSEFLKRNGYDPTA